MKRPCLTCGRLVSAPASRCELHSTRRSSDTRTTTQKGLGADHQKMRERVLREERTCWLCGLPGTVDDPLTADHVTPRSKGGTNERSNYHAAHASCNSARGARTIAAKPQPAPPGRYAV